MTGCSWWNEFVSLVFMLMFTILLKHSNINTQNKQNQIHKINKIILGSKPNKNLTDFLLLVTSKARSFDESKQLKIIFIARFSVCYQFSCSAATSHLSHTNTRASHAAFAIDKGAVALADSFLVQSTCEVWQSRCQQVSLVTPLTCQHVLDHKQSQCCV